jgi:hypothetical protein
MGFNSGFKGLMVLVTQRMVSDKCTNTCLYTYFVNNYCEDGNE